MTLGERIRISRMQKKMSQSELARIAEIHQKNISKYENDGVVPSAVTLGAIADALGVTTDYLIGRDTENVLKDASLLKRFKEVDNMPENIKSALAVIIDAMVRDYKAQQAYS